MGTQAYVEFYYNDEGLLVSCARMDEDVEYLSPHDTRRLLRLVDKYEYDSVNLRHNSIKLKNDESEIVLSDLRNFMKSGEISLLPNTLPKIKKEIADYNRRIAANKKHQNIQLGRRRVIAGSAALLTVFMLAVGAHHFGKDVALDEPSTVVVTNEPKYEPNISIEEFVADAENNAIESEPVTPVAPVVKNPVYIDFSFTNDLEKKNHAYDNFHDIVYEEATRYGISPNLIMAMLTQETGGYLDNLMQIQFYSWEDMHLRIYNFETNSYDHFVLTDNPANYAGTEYTTISRRQLLDPRTNIKIACAIFRITAENMDYHILASLQCYNFGVNNMGEVLNLTASETHKTVEEILADQSDASFIDYTSVIDSGDKNYIKNVLSYIDSNGEALTLKHLNEDGEIVTEEVTVYAKNQVKTLD